MKVQEIEAFLKLVPQIKSAYDEISLLSKKRPSDVVNKFKLRFVNNMLGRANALLGKDYMPFPGEFELFDEADLPNNGDVVLILANYLMSLEKLRMDNIGYSRDYSRWYWIANNKFTDIETAEPRRR